MSPIIITLAAIGLLAVFALTSRMRSKSGPLKQYRSDYRKDHENDGL